MVVERRAPEANLVSDLGRTSRWQRTGVVDAGTAQVAGPVEAVKATKDIRAYFTRPSPGFPTEQVRSVLKTGREPSAFKTKSSVFLREHILMSTSAGVRNGLVTEGAFP